jgi:integrase/recombinase XerC
MADLASTDVSRPEWFAAFLADRGTRKPSVHTLKAYRQDFDAIATLVAGDAAAVARMPLADMTTDSMRTAFAQYAESHEAASIQRCWSTWKCCAPSSTPRSSSRPTRCR